MSHNLPKADYIINASTRLFFLINYHEKRFCKSTKSSSSWFIVVFAFKEHIYEPLNASKGLQNINHCYASLPEFKAPLVV